MNHKMLKVWDETKDKPTVMIMEEKELTKYKLTQQK